MLVNDLLLLASKGLNNPQAARLTSSISLHFSFQQSNPVFPLAFHSVPWRLTASSLARPARPPAHPWFPKWERSNYQEQPDVGHVILSAIQTPATSPAHTATRRQINERRSIRGKDVRVSRGASSGGATQPTVSLPKLYNPVFFFFTPFHLFLAST